MKNYLHNAKKEITKKPALYFMIVPVLLYFTIFCYAPMYGAIIAFKDYSPGKGILGSSWVGFTQFTDFFNDIYFARLIRNTLRISITDLLINFPLPIIFALLLNEVGNMKFKKFVQSVSYVPHFISVVVVCGMVKQFVSDSGFITQFLSIFGVKQMNLLSEARYYVPIHVLSNTWQGLGWGSIIYLSALSSIDGQLYEAAELDGAGRLKRTWHVTLPGIAPTISILLIMRVGQLLAIGYEKNILLYNPAIYDTADIISSYVYRKGLLEFNWSYSTAVGLFNSVLNIILLVAADLFSKKIGQSGLF